MFLNDLKALLVKAVADTFDSNYPLEVFQDLNVSTEMPVRKQDYPAIFVSFSPMGALANSGIGHVEMTTEDEGDTWGGPLLRWRFQGRAEFTIVALSSRQRDELVDEMIKVLGFGQTLPGRSAFRGTIEDNEFIGVDADWEHIHFLGTGESPGTPWGTNDWLYEMSLGLDMQGEFLTSPEEGGEALQSLSRIDVYSWTDLEDAPSIPGVGDWE
jgi:hypothetical protein